MSPLRAYARRDGLDAVETLLDFVFDRHRLSPLHQDFDRCAEFTADPLRWRSEPKRQHEEDQEDNGNVRRLGSCD
eukprot:9503744-Prorocentrum_lima.AAC.1